MKVAFKRVVLLVLVLTMVVSVFPLTGYAATSYTEGVYKYTVSNEKATITDCDTSVSGELVIPSELGGYPVTSIGRYAFYGCSDLVSVTIPDGVIGLENSAFAECTNLISVSIPDSVTSIGTLAFAYCNALSDIDIPDGVTAIGGMAFTDCKSLTSIDIPDGVTSISISAFQGCEKLESITIPDGVINIGSSAFKGCSALNEVKIPVGVTELQASVFEKCTSLVDFTVPENVTTIGENAFSGCSLLTSIALPEKLKSIGDSAFSGCIRLANVHYQSNSAAWDEITIGDYNSYLTAAYRHYNSTGSGIVWSFADGTLTIGGTGAMDNYIKYDNSIVRPWEAHIKEIKTIVVEEGVTSIGSSAFEKCINLANVKLSEGVTDISSSAFENCYRLLSIVLPESLATVGEAAFSNCYSLQNLHYAGDSSSWENIVIGDYNDDFDSAYRYYNSTGSNIVWSILDNVLYISGTGTMDNYKYYGGSYGRPWEAYIDDILGVVVEEGVTSIGNFAFKDCSELSYVILPSSIKKIGTFALIGVDAVVTYNCDAEFKPDDYKGRIIWLPYHIGKEIALPAIPATYYSSGLTEGSYCDICKEAIVEQDVIPRKKLSSPKNVKAVSAGYDRIKVSWNAVEGAEGYAVYRSTSKSGTYDFLYRTLKLSVTNAGRTTGTTYYYKIRPYVTIDGVKTYGAYSAAVSAKPLPAKPTGVKAVSAGYNSIKASWSKVAGATGYKLYCSTSGKDGTFYLSYTTNDPNKISVNVLNRTSGKTYYFKVRAIVKKDGVTVSGALSNVFTGKAKPSTPTITLTKPASGKAKVAWGSIKGASGYEVYRSTSGKEGTFTLKKRTTSLSYTNTSLTKGKTYYYKVRAYRLVDGKRVYGSFSAVKSLKV